MACMKWWNLSRGGTAVGEQPDWGEGVLVIWQGKKGICTAGEETWSQAQIFC